MTAIMNNEIAQQANVCWNIFTLSWVGRYSTEMSEREHDVHAGSGAAGQIPGSPPQRDGEGLEGPIFDSLCVSFHGQVRDRS